MKKILKLGIGYIVIAMFYATIAKVCIFIACVCVKLHRRIYKSLQRGLYTMKNRKLVSKSLIPWCTLCFYRSKCFS